MRTSSIQMEPDGHTNRIENHYGTTRCGPASATTTKYLGDKNHTKRINSLRLGLRFWSNSGIVLHPARVAKDHGSFAAYNRCELSKTHRQHGDDAIGASSQMTVRTEAGYIPVFYTRSTNGVIRMSPTTFRSTRSLLLAAIAFTGVQASPVLASNSDAIVVERSANADTVLERASSLIENSKLIRARAMLNALQSSPAGATLSDEQGQRLWTLAANIERQLKKTDRLEISLQKAELALLNDNLVEANDRQRPSWSRASPPQNKSTAPKRSPIWLMSARLTR